MKDQKKLLIALTIIVGIYLVAIILIGIGGSNAAVLIPFLAVSGGLFIFAHGTARFGIKNLMLLIGIGAVVSLFYESLSIATGFPYSGYHYTEILGPKLMGFPIMVMVGYGILSYIFWATAETLISQFNNQLRGANIVFVPVLAAFLFTSWDLALDPIGSTVSKAYIWDLHGSYFGIPFQNFMGWYLATYTIFQIFALFIYRQNLDVPAMMKKKSYWYQSIFMYAAIFVQLPILMIYGGNEQISVFSGQVFQTNDIYQAMTLVGITAILFPAFIGFVNVFNTKELE
jgi:putative membrane protein